jgi:hypothetical protein
MHHNYPVIQALTVYQKEQKQKKKEESRREKKELKGDKGGGERIV